MTNFNSNFDFTYPMSDTGVKMLLVASTALPWTVPGTADQKFRATFSYNANAEVWVKLNGTAAAPTSGVATATYNEQLRPKHLYVVGGDVLSFISTGTPQVGVSLLAIPG